MSDLRTSRVVVRVLQLLPVLAIGLLVALWLCVPYNLAPVFMASQSRGDMPAEVQRESRVQTVDYMAQEARAQALGLSGTGRTLDSVTADAWTAWVEALPLHASRSDVFGHLPLSGTSAAFASLTAWEKAYHARVWAWVVTGPTRPALVASSTSGPDLLANVLLMARSDIDQPTSDGSAPPRSFEEWLWRETTMPSGLVPQFATQSLSVGDHGGGGPSEWQLNTCTLVGGNELYTAVVLGPGDPTGTQGTPTYDDVARLDPTASGFRAQLEKLAARRGINVWVYGPLKLGAVPLRVPKGATQADAERLGTLAWPSFGIRQADNPMAATPLTAEEARLTRANVGAMYVRGADATPYYGGNGNLRSYRATDVLPQSVAFLATWEDTAAPVATGSETTGVGETGGPLHVSAVPAWQLFLAEWFPLLLGGAVGFLALSLVVSSGAFVYERRAAARDRAREEVSRMRRDAHDKVYNRLSALSKRIAASGEEVAAHNAAVLGTIAEDIRTTVGELQGILGEDGSHAEGVLTSVPLAEQLLAVCQAQAARLEAEVSCDVPEELPAVDARLGWDLQCIAEEAITNAVRHGAATRVSVRVSATEGELVLTVRDNGSGSPSIAIEALPDDSTGLRGAAARLERWSGTLGVGPAPEGGTLLAVRIPLGED